MRSSLSMRSERVTVYGTGQNQSPQCLYVCNVCMYVCRYGTGQNRAARLHGRQRVYMVDSSSTWSMVFFNLSQTENNEQNSNTRTQVHYICKHIQVYVCVYVSMCECECVSACILHADCPCTGIPHVDWP